MKRLALFFISLMAMPVILTAIDRYWPASWHEAFAVLAAWGGWAAWTAFTILVWARLAKIYDSMKPEEEIL